MRPFTTQTSRFMLALATFLATACSSDTPTNVTRSDAALARARTPAPAYTTTSLGILPGDNSSRANGVNDAGEVAGYSCCSPGSRAFVTLSGVMTVLEGDRGMAFAISNGSPRYVVGAAGATSRPVRWTIIGSAASPPTNLGVSDVAYGVARGVNDFGQSVGNLGNSAAMWDVDGNLTVVPAPEGFVRGEGRAINNDGDAVFAFWHPDTAWPDGIALGYLRLATGEMIALPPIVASGITYANDLASRVGTTVGIAGSSYASAYAPTAVRWTVDVVQQQIVGRDVRSEVSHATGISEGGSASGFTEGSSNSLRTNAFLWRGNQLLMLDPPKGGKEGKAWTVSPNGQFVAGEAMLQPGRTAILWRIAAP